TTAAYSPWWAARWALIRRATSVPPATPREPPSTKSFWTSTTSSARLMSPIVPHPGGVPRPHLGHPDPRAATDPRPHPVARARCDGDGRVHGAARRHHRERRDPLDARVVG